MHCLRAISVGTTERLINAQVLAGRCLVHGVLNMSFSIMCSIILVLNKMILLYVKKNNSNRLAGIHLVLTVSEYLFIFLVTL